MSHPFFRIIALLQLVPLSIFILIFRIKGDWEIAFEWGGACSMLQILIWSLNKWLINSIMLGVNLFLIVGAIAFLTKNESLLIAYSEMRETSLFVGILVAGVISTIFFRGGFIERADLPRSSVVKGSLLLLVVTLIALVSSYLTRGDLLLAGVVPLLLILMAKRLSRRKLSVRQDVDFLHTTRKLQ